MRKQRIYVFAAIISCMLITLVATQLLWLLHTADAEKREAGLRIDKALAAVGEQLRDRSFCIESYAKTFVDSGERFYMVRRNRDASLDTIDILYDEAFTKDKNVGKISSMSFRYPYSMEIQMSAFLIVDDTTSYYSERDDFYEKLNSKRLNDIIRSAQPIDSIYDMDDVDSLLKSELVKAKADTQYAFGFVSAEDSKIDYTKRTNDTTALLSSAYYVSLFADNRFMKPYRLALVFPSDKGVSLNRWMLISIVIVVLLTASFIAFVRLYLKQNRLSQMKTDFINNLTHEFNTPMTNISLALETLENQQSAQDGKTQNVIDIITHESTRLRENIERALQVAVMEDGQLQLRKEDTDLVQLINTVMSTYTLQCEALGGSISFLHPPESWVVADETHLINCIVNLLDNALKYRNGAPRILIAIEENDGNIQLLISDNGIGMSSDTQKHIFDKFYRAHEGDTHNTKGFGLGLSYVKGIVTAMGGSIEVWSKRGIGSRFTIRFPKVTDND